MRTMSKEQFEGSYAWKRKREKILRRDEGLCVECRRYGRKDRDGKPSCGAEEVQTWVAKQRAGNGPKSNEMVFGYTNPEQNHFRRFRVRFYPESGSVKVEL